MREHHGEEAAVRARARAAQRVDPRGRGRPVVAVGDVQRRHLRERGFDRLGEYGLAAVDVEREWNGVREALGALQIAALKEPGEATLDRITEQLRGGIDVLGWRP